MASEDPQMKVRLPEALKERIAQVARANNRSMNAEIIYRLERSFGYADEKSGDLSIIIAVSNIIEATLISISKEIQKSKLSNYCISEERIIKMTSEIILGSNLEK